MSVRILDLRRHMNIYMNVYICMYVCMYICINIRFNSCIIHIDTNINNIIDV